MYIGASVGSFLSSPLLSRLPLCTLVEEGWCARTEPFWTWKSKREKKMDQKLKEERDSKKERGGKAHPIESTMGG